MPGLFTSHTALGVAACTACLIIFAAMRAEDQLQPLEDRLITPRAGALLDYGPVVLRLGLAIMLGLAALGGLPRHGTPHWTEPTLLVPDMQLALVSGADWLVPAQLCIAVFLLAGLGTRALGGIVVVLSVLGLFTFGPVFLSYTPHFAAPGFILLLTGGGAWSGDRSLGLDHPFPIPTYATWRAAQVLTGVGFIYLAVAYKLFQPTLLIAILQHGEFPTFGLPYPVVALIMTGVEIICGILLALGRLVRPVALTITAAITFLALVLGETPLFHANLYGCMVMFALVGRSYVPSTAAPRAFGLRRSQA
ncbi:hypothetical protein [Roseivivax halodurans]|nr:hypothetical protein [Roseivivax halodurans]